MSETSAEIRRERVEGGPPSDDDVTGVIRHQQLATKGNATCNLRFDPVSLCVGGRTVYHV